MKEWKGNSNSLRAAIAVKSKNSTNERQENDFYATDPRALEKLIIHTNNRHVVACGLEICKHYYGHYSNYIWECAAGNGNLSNWLRENGYNVIASDLKYRGCTDGSIVDGVDFLKTIPKERFKGAAGNPFIILTNPPYSLANEFILHALEILPDGGLYIALMNITYLAGQKRYREIYSKGSLREIYVFSKRVECWKNNIPSGHSSIANYAWYVFQKGYKGQPTLYWL